MRRGFDVFFDLRLNKRLSKQARGWQFETPSRPLWCHCNEIYDEDYDRDDDGDGDGDDDDDDGDDDDDDGGGDDAAADENDDNDNDDNDINDDGDFDDDDDDEEEEEEKEEEEEDGEDGDGGAYGGCGFGFSSGGGGGGGGGIYWQITQLKQNKVVCISYQIFCKHMWWILWWCSHPISADSTPNEWLWDKGTRHPRSTSSSQDQVSSRNFVTSWHGHTLRITGPLWGESIGHRWIPHTMG